LQTTIFRRQLFFGDNYFLADSDFFCRQLSARDLFFADNFFLADNFLHVTLFFADNCLYGHTPFLAEEGGRAQTKLNQRRGSVPLLTFYSIIK
jgi:hypothetical protein